MAAGEDRTAVARANVAAAALLSLTLLGVTWALMIDAPGLLLLVFFVVVVVASTASRRLSG